MIFQVEDNAGDAALGFGDANLLQQLIANGNDVHPFFKHGRLGADDIEEEAIGIGQAIGLVMKIGRDFDGYAGDVAQGPEADGSDFRGLAFHRGVVGRAAETHSQREHGACDHARATASF